jgi:hypothetical protein
MMREAQQFILALFCLAIILLIACDLGTPPAPLKDNPFYPENPYDLFHLTAEISGGGITLNWTPVLMECVAGYNLYGNVDDSLFTLKYQSSTRYDSTYLDTGIQNGRKYSYYIVARNVNGDTSVSNTTALVVNSNPILSIDDTSGFISVRQVNLTLLAFGASSMQIGTPFVDDGDWLPYSTTATAVFDSGSDEPVEKIVQARFAYPNGDTSLVVSDTTYPLPMNSSLIIADDSLYTASREVTLNLYSAGVLWMLLSNEPLVWETVVAPELDWLEYDTTYTWNLDYGEGAKGVFGYFLNDFGYISEATDFINPLPLEADYNIDHNANYSATRAVWLYPSAQGVNLMWKFSQDSLFSGCQWQILSDSLNFLLSAGAGNKVVYVKIRNDFQIESPLLADTIAPLPMNPNLNIDHNAQYTADRTVWLYPQAQGANLVWKFALDTLFASVQYQALSDSVNYQLPTGAGTKTIFAKFKNDFEIESGIISASIEPLPMNPALNIAHNAQYTPTRLVWLFPQVQGYNIRWQYSDDMSFPSGQWSDLIDSISFILDSGEGAKTVYAKFKNDFDIESAIVSDDIAPLPMNPNLNIAHNATYTPTRNVWIFPSADGSNLTGKISEDNTFGGISWQFLTDSVEFILSTGNNLKTVYGIFKNDFDIESGIVNDDIYPQPITNTGVIIASDSLYINHNLAVLSITGEGVNELKLSATGDSTSSPWSAFTNTVTGFDLGSGDGLKYAYAWYSNDFYIDGPDYDSVYLDTQCQIDTLYWSATGGDTLQMGETIHLTLIALEDNLGLESGGFPLLTLPGVFSDLPLNDNLNGSYSSDYIIQSDDYCIGGIIAANFIDRAGNIAVPFNATNALNISTFWEDTYGGSSDDYSRCVLQTSDGNYVIAGETNSYGGGEGDAWLFKVDGNGNQMWNRNFGGTSWDGASCAKETEDGGFIIIGSTYSYGAGNCDIWLLKTDMQGNEEWNRTFGGNNEDMGFGLCQTADGGFILAGHTRSYGGTTPKIWLIKTDSQGNQQWNHYYSTANTEFAYDIKITSDGGYVVVGSASSYTFSFIKLLKTDASGNEQWENVYESSIHSCGYGVEQTPDGGYVIVGYKFLSDEDDVCLIKINSSGFQLWSRYFDGGGDDWGYSLEQLADGGFIVTGMKGLPSAHDVWLFKTDSQGYQQWSREYGGSGNDWGRCVKQTSDGGYIIVGRSDSFGGGDFDSYLIKVAPIP